MRRHVLLLAAFLAATFMSANVQARDQGLLLGGNFETLHSPINGVENIRVGGEFAIDNWYDFGVGIALLQDASEGRVKPAYGIRVGVDTLQDAEQRDLQAEVGLDVFVSPDMLTRVLGEAAFRFPISEYGFLGGYIEGSYASTWNDDVVVYGDLRQDDATVGLGVSLVSDCVNTRFHVGPAFVFSNVRDDEGISRAREVGGVLSVGLTHISDDHPLWVSVKGYAGIVQNDSGDSNVTNQSIGGLSLTVARRNE